MDFVELFNQIATVVKTGKSRKCNIYATGELDRLSDLELDSLDYIMLFVYLADIYNIPEQIAKQLEPKTVRDIKDFVALHKTRDPQTIEEAISYVG